MQMNWPLVFRIMYLEAELQEKRKLLETIDEPLSSDFTANVQK